MRLIHPTSYDRDPRAFLGRRRDSWWLAPLRRAVGAAHHALNWSDNDPMTNGECMVLDRLPEKPLVVDVGAHVGEWTDLVRSGRPGCRVVCVEVSAAMRQRLLERFDDDPQCVIWPTGLWSAAGTVQLKSYPCSPRLNSLVDYPHRLAAEWSAVEVTTGDALVSAAGIDHIDLLKIDTEGSELQVLTGFRTCLQEGRIDRIQFEYGRANIYSRSLLLDFYEMLEPLGFRIGRIGARGVAFTPYEAGLEDFFVSNRLASRVD